MFYENDLVKNRKEIIYINIKKDSNHYYWSKFFVKTDGYDRWYDGFAEYEIWYMGNHIGIAESWWGADQGDGYHQTGVYWF